MKNVPVPVYCRPLVEKDPNRKVRNKDGKITVVASYKYPVVVITSFNVNEDQKSEHPLFQCG